MYAFTIWIQPASYYDAFNPCIPAVVYQMHNYETSLPRCISQQPEWEFAGNIGDASPLDYGGGFVYRDKTGVYPPEVHFWHEREPRGKFKVYRFQCEECFYNGGILSDNKYHKDSAVWFADDLSSMGFDPEEMIDAFLSSDPMKQAFAWKSVGRHWGYENLDSCPDEYTLAEMEIRYAVELAAL